MLEIYNADEITSKSSTLTTTENRTTLPYFISTGKKCDTCGRELLVFKAKILGTIKQFPVACRCINEARKKRELEAALSKKKEYLEKLFRQSRLGERFRNASFDNFIVDDSTKPIFELIKKYTDNFHENKKKSIILSGPPGTGKTLLASSIVNTLIEKCISAIFISVPDLMSQITASYTTNNITEDKIFMGLNDCDLLVLDEIGLRKPKEKDDWTSEKLYQVINSRYANMKATVFTTNCSLNELSDRLGFRTFSRILEMCMDMNFDFSKANDWRMKNIMNSHNNGRDR